jgi:predicted permease
MSRRKRILENLGREIQDFLGRETAANIASGMSPEDARHAALRKFGNITRVKEDTRAVWTSVWTDELLQDLRYAFRTLRNAPVFAAVAVLTLALGIGANTAIFSLIDAVMLRSLPVANPAQLVLLKWSARNPPRLHGIFAYGDCPTDMRAGGDVGGCSLSSPMFREIRDSNQFAGVAAFANSGPLSFTGQGPAAMITGQLVSGDFFRTLGLKPAAGRLLETAGDSPNAAPVAVLNYGFWRSRFGGSQDVIGRTIDLNSVAFTVIGVAEQRFTGITPGSNFDVWLPLSVGPQITKPASMWQNRQDDPGMWWLTVLGRLKPGVPVTQVQTAVSGIFANAMLHGAVPLFDLGAGPLGPFAPSPAPGPVRSQVSISGPGPLPAPALAARGGGAPASANAAASRNAEITSSRANGPQSPAAPPSPAGAPARTLSKPGDNPQITLVNAQTGLIGSRARFADPLYVLMCAVGIILLIACSNVAGLMLARAAARQKEMALRLALGAGRSRIVRQLLTESIILAAMGGILGVAFAYWGAHAILSFVSSNQPRPLAFAAGLDSRVLLFTIAISLVTGILFGLAPAFRSARVDLTPALKEGFGVSTGFAHGAARRFTMGNVLVVAQVALAILVLVGAGLLVRTLQNLRGIDIGFDARNIVLFSIDPSLAGYKSEQVDSFYRDLQGRLAETPGVRSASYSMMPLLSGGMMRTGFHWPGTPQDRESESDVLPVGPDFFATMQVPFLAGRNFTSSDFAIAAAKSARVPVPVIVDQAFVRKYLGNEEPIGKRFGQAAATEDEPATPGYEIVGVVRDTKYGNLRREINPTMFTPLNGSAASFEVRTAGDPQALIPIIRNTVAQIDPNLPLRDVSTQSQQIDRLLFQERLVARLSGFFGLLALLLACIGLYGLLAYEVARRTREVGIRMALGAQARDVLGLVLRQGLALVIAGTVLGIGLAIGLTRYLKSMLFDVRANDPLTLSAVALLPLVVAAAACFVPARRATEVDPLVALRHE